MSCTSKTPALWGYRIVTEHNFEQLRRAMVTGQLRTNAVNDPRVVAAMSGVPREAYVPRDLAPIAYTDRTLPLGGGRALPTPMVTGRLVTEARVRAGERALVIGAGPGYAAAVLAALGLHVTALEAADGPAATAPAGTVARVQGPLAEGWAAGAPYDLILFDGAVERVPDGIVAQLAEDGRLATGLVRDGVTRLALGRKSGGGFGIAIFADAEVPVLPGFAAPSGFRF